MSPLASAVMNSPPRVMRSRERSALMHRLLTTGQSSRNVSGFVAKGGTDLGYRLWVDGVNYRLDFAGRVTTMSASLFQDVTPLLVLLAAAYDPSGFQGPLPSHDGLC